jgi:hypothetical protein
MAVVDVNLEAVDSELHGGLLIDLFSSTGLLSLYDR